MLTTHRFEEQGFTFITLNPGYVQTELHGSGKDQVRIDRPNSWCFPDTV